MTEVKLPKYRVIRAENFSTFEAKLDALANEGYTLASFNPIIAPANMNETMFYAIVKLAEDSYEGVTNLRDVAPELVDECLRNNWRIASSSISTKFVRMVRYKTLK